MSWNVVLKQTCSTDVCVCTCVADVHPQQQTYRFVTTICAKPVSSSETSGRFVIPLWTEVEWIRLILFTIRAQYNSSTDSNKSRFITKHLLVHGKNTRKKMKLNMNAICVLKWVWSNNSHPGRPSFFIILKRLERAMLTFLYVLYSDIMCSDILNSSLHT